MLNKNLLSLIALHLDDISLLRLCRANKKISEVIDNNFWRNKLLHLGMKNVSKENIEDPKEAYKQMVSIGEYHNSRGMILNAASLGKIYPIKYLLEQGCQLKDLALVESSYSSHLKIVKYLVEQKADIHVQYDSPLRAASQEGHIEVVKYLVEQGADIHNSNLGHNNAIYLAKRYNHTEIIDYLNSIVK